MAEVRYTLKRGGPPYEMSEEERRHFESLTDEQIIAAAEADPDNPPLSEEQLQGMWLKREVRRARQATGLSQPQFAERYHIGVGRLRDFEQGRSKPDVPMLAYLRLIASHPDIADELVRSLEPVDAET